MRKLFWIALGAAGAAYVLTKGRKVARRYTPDGVAEQLEEGARTVGNAIKDARDAFAAAYAERAAALEYALTSGKDVDGLKAQRATRKADRQAHGQDAEEPDESIDGPPTRPGRPHRRPGDNRRDPDDDGDLPYEFF